MGEVKEWVKSFKGLKVINRRIDKYGILRLGSHMISDSAFGSEGGSWWFANSFLTWRKRDPNAQVVLKDFGLDKDSILVATFSDGSQDTIHPIEVLYIDNHPYTGVVMEGGYILRQSDSRLLENFFSAEQGKEPSICDDGTFLRYSRDANFLRRSGNAVEAPVGQEVIVFRCHNYQECIKYKVFTQDEVHFPFEEVGDLISYERWGRPLPEFSELERG